MFIVLIFCVPCILDLRHTLAIKAHVHLLVTCVVDVYRLIAQYVATRNIVESVANFLEKTC